jgi:hypothetical protein
MLPGPFLRRLTETVRAHLPPDDQPLHIQPRGRLIKIWYGPDASIHYEVWIHERTQQLELGLHCESDAARNARIYRGLSGYLLEIKLALGIGVELEPWDKGWVRLYETHPLYPLDEARLDEFARRVGEFVGVVQPIYAEICRELRLER